MTTSPIKVLVVGDSADDADLMLLELRRDGYAPSAERVETAAGFRAALAGQAWDVILCDDSMPDLDAEGALGLLRESGLDVPLVVVSGTTGEERAGELMRAGAADYLTKGRLSRLAPAVEREVRQAAGRKALRQAEREARDLAAIVAWSDDAIVGKALDGTVTSWNAGAERLYGYAAGEIVGHSISRVVSPDRPDEEADLLGRVARGERIEHFETERVRKDGTRVHVSVTLSPVRDDAGRVVGASVVARDITRRNQAEQDLRRASDLLRAVADGTPDAVFVKDRAGRYMLFNESACRFVGKPVGDVLGRDDTALFDPADARRVMDRDRRVMESGEAETDEEVLTAAGATRTYLATKGPYRDGHGNVIGLIGISRDITDRKEAEGALRESEERLRVALTAAGAVAFVWDAVADRVIRYHSVEPTLPVNVGAPETVADVLARIHPDDRGRFEAGVRACLAAGTEYRNLYRVARDDGSVRWLEEWGTLSRDAAGGPVRLVGISIDVTDREAADAVVREREELLHAVINYIPCGVFWKDRDSVLLGCNNQFAQDLGACSPGDLIGKTDAQLAPPAEADAFVARDRRVIETGEPLLNVEEPRSMFDGRTMTLLTSKVPLRGPGGAVIGVLGVYQDITERKLADAERADLLARLNLQIERMPLAYLLSGPDFLYTGWNPAAERTFGFTRTEALGRHPFEVVVPQQSQAVVADVFARLAAGEMDAHGTCENATKDGRVITCEWYNTPLFDPDGTFRGVLSLAQDITARRQAEHDLLLRDRAIQAITGGIIITDAGRPDHPIIYASPGFERLTGYAGAEVVGRNCRFLQGPGTDPQAVAAVREAVRDARPCDVELLNYRKDGTPFWNALSVSPVRDDAGRLTHFVGVQTDVTGRREAERELHLRDRAIQGLSQGILIADATRPDYPVVYASPGYLRLSGYADADLLGRTCQVLYGPDTDPEELARMRRAVAAREGYSGELLCYRKDGTKFWDETHLTPFASDEQMTYYIGLHTDVTRRRKLEEQFQQAQKMEAVGQLAGGLAHDFNNLLTVINGYGAIVHDALPPGDPSRELVAEITKAGERAAGLTRQLLAFSRQSVLEPKVLDPNALVRDVERMLRRLIGEDIDMATRLAPDLGRVKADPGQLEQAVVNLCVNARDAMPTGGKLTVETWNVELEAGYAATRPDVRPGPYVLLAVSDTGTGMTPEIQARVFEPFFTTKEQGKGTGLGLAMVFGFVKQSGGHVEVHSEVGRGTTFKLYLPRVGEAPLAGKSAVGRMPVSLGTETVLLVEDEPVVRALGRHILEMCGYTVLEAGNGEEAVRVADEHAGPLHILVTDVVMPGGMGGRQLAEAVVARVPGTKVLFTSGYTDDYVVRHGVLEEGTHFLQKPFTPAAFAGKVRDVLDGRE